jgi:hypothetical protein
MPVLRDHSAAPLGAAAPIARAAAAEARAARRAAVLARDLFHPDEARLDDRTRAAARALLAGHVQVVERAVRLGAARRLTRWGEPAAAEWIARDASALDRLEAAGVLADAELVAELVARAELAQLARDLPALAGAPDRPSLLVRLAECPEAPVAEAAAALLAAANSAGTAAPLSDDLQPRLAWWVAAALAEAAEPRHALALAEAAAELLAGPPAPDEVRAAIHLAAAVAAHPDELPDLLAECLGDRQPVLFAAFLAEALALPFDEARSVLIDRDGARLALCLRAAGLERPAIARIGVALAGADPRRDLERFADELDEVAALAPVDAVAALAPLALPLAFRRARRELGQ